MLQIENTLVSLDIIEKKFVCDLNACKGECCIDGDSGAPLEEEEVKILEEIYPLVEPYVTRKGREVAKKDGLTMVDEEGDTVTTLIDKKECMFTIFEKGIALCAIDKAYRDGKVKFQKPISCFLYPIRVKKYADFVAVNYDKWEICKPARILGEKTGVPVYKFLKEPLLRKFGKEWYEQLEYAAENMDKNK